MIVIPVFMKDLRRHGPGMLKVVLVGLSKALLYYRICACFIKTILLVLRASVSRCLSLIKVKIFMNALYKTEPALMP